MNVSKIQSAINMNLEGLAEKWKSADSFHGPDVSSVLKTILHKMITFCMFWVTQLLHEKAVTNSIICVGNSQKFYRKKICECFRPPCNCYKPILR